MDKGIEGDQKAPGQSDSVSLPPEFSVEVVSSYRPIFTITSDRRVIIEGDIYEAAREFWAIVRKLAPNGWSVEEGPL